MAKLRERLLAWYRQSRRDLPWRRTRDPYAVWISEVMLQQTRVDTVLPYYDRFLERWPTVRALAAADAESVRAAWSGLGYYRRAKLMLEAAQQITSDHGGELPDDPVALRNLPGFGRYTAGAVASIAFERDVPAVDGNVLRFLARLRGIEGDVSRGQANHAIWEAADALVAGGAPGDLNQALIELGATVCTVRNPACERCPAQVECVAHSQGRQHEIPPPRKRATRKRVELTALIAMSGGRHIILEQRPEDGLLAGLWSPPLLDGHLAADSAADEASRRWGWALDHVADAGEVTHVLTHRDLVMKLVTARTDETPPAMLLVDVAQLPQLGIPSVTTRALRAALPDAALAVARLPGRRTRQR